MELILENIGERRRRNWVEACWSQVDLSCKLEIDQAVAIVSVKCEVGDSRYQRLISALETDTAGQ